jgi:hypothetical protein
MEFFQKKAPEEVKVEGFGSPNEGFESLQEGCSVKDS